MNKRNVTFDLLKFIGMNLIIFAHCQNKPPNLDYLRNFEVILLMLVSAMLNYNKYETSRNFDKELFRKVILRIRRLIIPTWFFLCCFFLCIFFVTQVRKVPFPYSVNTILESFLMINGIGYVWIMLCYCWVAIGLPMLIIVFNKWNISNVLKMIILGMGFIVYEILRMFLLNQPDMVSYYIKNTVMYFVGYCFICFIPYALKKYLNLNFLKQGIGFLAIHVGGLLIVRVLKIDALQLMSSSKYPPSFFYITYGLGASLILYALLVNLKIDSDSAIGKIVTVFGKHSQWIYFDHIFAIFIYNEVCGSLKWYGMFVFVFAIALLLLLFERLFVILLKRTMMERIKIIFSILLGEKI